MMMQRPPESLGQSFLSDIYKHKDLPIYTTEEFDFFRCVEFKESMYGRTVSALHSGNLRDNDGGNRHSGLFPTEKTSYWSDEGRVARAEVKRHGAKNNLLTFWAYDDSTSTIPTINPISRMHIISGNDLGFKNILEKSESNVPLSSNDEEILDRIIEEHADGLAYSSQIDPWAINYLFFERGFNKLSLRQVRLRLGDRDAINKNRIICADNSDYIPYPEAYGRYFKKYARIYTDIEYQKSDEYTRRTSVLDESYELKKKNYNIADSNID